MFISTTSEILENRENYKILGAVHSQASRGMGLWTSICMGFANVFGTKCKHYSKKIELAKKEALDNIIAEAEKAGANGIVDIRFTISGLSVVVSGTTFAFTSIHDQSSSQQNELNNKSGVKATDVSKQDTAEVNINYFYYDDIGNKRKINKGTRVVVTRENLDGSFEIEFVDLENGRSIKANNVPKSCLSFD